MFDNWGRVVLSSLVSVLVLFLLTKLLGKRQIAQLSMFDYVNGITIGSIAAELAIGRDGEYAGPLIAMVIYTLAAVGISIASNKSIRLRVFFEGKPLTLFDNNRLYEDNLARAMLDVNELLTNCRLQGYFDLADIQTIVMETNGQLSILPKSTARPVTPQDMGLKPEQDYMVANVIIDGNVMNDILKLSGNNEQWLQKQLADNGVKLSEVVLGTVDSDNTFTAYCHADRKDEEKNIII